MVNRCECRKKGKTTSIGRFFFAEFGFFSPFFSLTQLSLFSALSAPVKQGGDCVERSDQRTFRPQLIMRTPQFEPQQRLSARSL